MAQERDTRPSQRVSDESGAAQCSPTSAPLSVGQQLTWDIGYIGKVARTDGPESTRSGFLACTEHRRGLHQPLVPCVELEGVQDVPRCGTKSLCVQ